jgi:mycofactocin precursor
METKRKSAILPEEKTENPEIMEEVVIEELSIDGICGVY